jgi:hypothetical protein
MNDNHLVIELSFVAKNATGLRRLSGWKKGSRIPDRYSDAAGQFAADLARDELGKDLDHVYGRLKDAFGFRRRDLDTSEPMDGTGTIITPHFNYSITVSLNPDDLEEVIWRRTVDTIKNAAAIRSPAFGSVFDGVFDTIEFTLPIAVNIEQFIDGIEGAKVPSLRIDYDRACTYCAIQLKSGAGTVTVKPRSLSIVHTRPRKTAQLIDSFDTVCKLVNKYHAPLIPTADSAKKLPQPKRS